jgi:hypothetical protein
VKTEYFLSSQNFRFQFFRNDQVIITLMSKL